MAVSDAMGLQQNSNRIPRELEMTQEWLNMKPDDGEMWSIHTERTLTDAWTTAGGRADTALTSHKRLSWEEQSYWMCSDTKPMKMRVSSVCFLVRMLFLVSVHECYHDAEYWKLICNTCHTVHVHWPWTSIKHRHKTLQWPDVTTGSVSLPCFPVNKIYLLDKPNLEGY